MAEVVVSSGRRFTANHGESILDAALRQGVVLEYGCQTGRCGTCRARVQAGSTEARHDESGLGRVELTGGWILTCVRTASSDIELEVEDLTNVTVYPVRTLPCRIHDLQRVSETVIKVALRMPPDAGFEYHTGQYIDVVGHGGLRRSYSIANAPTTDRLLELHIRQVDGGTMSEYWFGRARVNDLLRLRGPLGTCFLREVAGKDLVFLATGTGIAPIKAMLEGLAASGRENHPRTVSIYWGGRVPEDLYWHPGRIDLEYTFVPVLSRTGSDWDGARGHVQDVLLQSQPDISRTVIYACGSDVMIRGARRALVDAGLPERAYRSDAFVSSGAY